MIQKYKQLLGEIGAGQMNNTAYDTAWVARLGELDYALSNNALDWICENQLFDGSWGTESPFYYHDRMICTLAAITALTLRGRRAHDRHQIERGLEAMERMTLGATTGLRADPAGATVGFEMIMPTLVAEAEKLGIIKNQKDRIMGRLVRQRAAKLELLQGKMISRYVTAAFSAEMAGPDAVRLLDIDNLQEANGSVGNCPSATAYFAAQVRPQDPAALKYLHEVVSKGGAPNVAPFDVFERSWVLWNLLLLEKLPANLLSLVEPHTNFLLNAWLPGEGVSPGALYTPRDSDDTSVTYEVLTRLEKTVDIESILSYETDKWFRCFKIESNPSISANVHVLGALRKAGLSTAHPSVQKAIGFLKSARTNDTFWFDKWHISSYYVTSHAIIACAGYENSLIEKAVEWIISTQNQNGSWGSYIATAEETAYCLQALAIWKRHGGKVAETVTRQGVEWLKDHIAPPYPPLWIGKCLYSPERVIYSAILSALLLSQE